MLAEIPNPEDYDVSYKTGFLPEETPLVRLPAVYDAWEEIAQQLPALLLAQKVRDSVHRMPYLSTTDLHTEPEWRRACSILGFIAHAYVWSKPSPADHLPKQLSEPWVATCEHFGLPAIGSFAGLCLWNYRFFDSKVAHDFSTTTPAVDEKDWLSELATITTYTGSMDESWFYLVSVAIEKQGAPSIFHGLEAIKAMRQDKVQDMVYHLQRLAEVIDGLIPTFARMYENCDPYVFYFKMRTFLAGWRNMAEAGLPFGVRYGDEKEPRVYAGGSNAQSSLIQVLDVLLGVEHNPVGERKPPKLKYGSLESDDPEMISKSPIGRPKTGAFLEEMRMYMPRKHRDFLLQLERVATIREYVVANCNTYPELVLAYDACLATLRAFRTKHIQVVTKYIVMMSKQKPTTSNEGIARNKGTTGTGGTSLLPFLKQARDETGDVAAGDWGRRLVTVLQSREPGTEKGSGKQAL